MTRRTIAYHDDEWGTPQHTHGRLLELDARGSRGRAKLAHGPAQAPQGTATPSRPLDPARVATFTDGDVERLMLDPGIIRNRGKITSVITNARALLALQQDEGSFAAQRP